MQIGEADLDNVTELRRRRSQRSRRTGRFPQRDRPRLPLEQGHRDRGRPGAASSVPNLAVSAAYTWRKSTDLTATQLLSGYYWYSWIGVTSADYHLGAPVTANGFTATPYVVNDGVADRITGGFLLRNRPDFSRTFQGLELSFVKRLANNWMARAAFSLNDWTESVGPDAIINPTHHDLDPQIDGGQSVPFSAGSGKNYYTSARWQVNVNGMYQLPAGFEIAANLFGRQGYPKPVYMLLDTGALDGNLNVLAVNEIDDDPAAEPLEPRPAPGQELAIRTQQPDPGRGDVQRAEREHGAVPQPAGQRDGLQPPGRDPRPTHRTRERAVRVLAESAGT